MFGISLQILDHLADAAVRSLGVALVAWIALTITRTRHSAARHAVWSVVLAGMLALPVLAALLPPLAVKVMQSPAPALNLEHRGSQSPAKSSSRIAAPSRRTAPIIPRWPVVLASLYLGVLAALLTRVIFAYRACRRLVRQSELISETSAQNLLSDLAAAQSMPWPLPELRYSHAVIVPMTVGSSEPVILLPDNWQNWDAWKLRAVLAHELAHIRRGDWLVTVAASMNRCLFWFHPLAWWLERRLAALAEQASDDAALTSMGDAPRYARTVLDFAAALQTGRRLTYGVAMARTAKVSRRIDRILEGRQPCPGVINRSTWIAIAACALPLVYSAAALQVAQSVPQPAVHPGLAELLTEGSKLTSAQAQQLEEQLVRDPEDLAARGKLLSYYTWNAVDHPRFQHVYWLIQHHPESQITIFYSQSHIQVPEDYEHEKQLWLEQVLAHPADAGVLANAAQFLGSNQFAEKDLLERARQADPSNPEWTKRLADLLSRAIRFSFIGPVRSESFAIAAKAELKSSTDAVLVGTVGEFLSGGLPSGPTPPQAQLDFAEHLLNGAQSLDPGNAEWPAALERFHAQQEDPPAATAKRIRVGAQVQQSNLVQSVDPVYPPLARQARIQGVVRFNVTISKDGHLGNITLVSGHPLLVESAKDAVKQWVYRPTLLNGDPVEVITAVDVHFTLER